MTITQEVDLDPGEVYQELHEPEHVALVLDGLADSIDQSIEGVTGVESLTAAQHYLEGALRASGSISYASVAGNEGFLSNVGDNIQKAWEYVKKMFKAIWDFFFKSEKKELEKKVDKALDDAYKSLDDLEKTSVNQSNVDEVLKKASTAANKIKDEPAKKKVQEEISAAREATTPEAKVKAAADIPEKVFKGFFINPSINGMTIQSIKGNVEKLTKLKEENHFDLGDDIQKIINGLIGFPESVVGIDDFASAKKYLDKSSSCRTAISNSLKTIENEKDTYEELIKGVEENIKTGGKDKQSSKDDLQKLKGGLVVITAIISETKSILDKMIGIAKQVSRACGDPV